MTSSSEPFLGGLLAPTVLLLAAGLWFLTSNGSNPKHGPKPPVLPSRIPFIGHGLTLMTAPNLIWDQASNYFKPMSVFSIFAGGQKFHIILKQSDALELYRKTKKFDFKSFIVLAQRKLSGMPDSGIKKITEPMKSKPTHPSSNSIVDDLGHFFGHSMQGPRLAEIYDRFAQEMERIFTTEDPLLGRQRKLPNGSAVVELSPWAEELMVTCSTNALFGRRLLRENPNIYENMRVTDNGQHKLFSLPRLLASDIFKARDAFMKSMINHYRQQRLDPSLDEDQSELARGLIEMCRAQGMDDRETGCYMFATYQPTQANTANISAYLIFYIVNSTTNLQGRLRDELLANLNGAPITNPPPTLMEACELFQAVWLELQRFILQAPSVRQCIEDTTIGGYAISRGDACMAPNRPTQMSAETFGPTVGEFRPERFLEKPELCRFVRGFGGGHQLCPGRFFAKQEVFLFTAYLLLKYELAWEADPDPRWGPNDDVFAGGIAMLRKTDKPMNVVLTPRVS